MSRRSSSRKKKKTMNFGRSQFLAEGTLISASAVPYLQRWREDMEEGVLGWRARGRGGGGGGGAGGWRQGYQITVSDSVTYSIVPSLCEQTRRLGSS